MTSLVQLRKRNERRVALVEEPRLRLLSDFTSVYDLAQAAIDRGAKLAELARERAKGDQLDYDSVYDGRSEWRILPPINHPVEPARCLISGTGLTHLGSARDRQAMHAGSKEDLTDSMKMFRLGLEGGRPPAGEIGAAPEWFYKGNGTMLRAHGDPLDVPAFALDGGEEAEIAGVYLIDSQGQPRRIGLAGGNEFSDHRFEKTNYLNLASSKMRTSSLGPELVLDPKFDSVGVDVAIERGGKILWSKSIRTGEAEMCHSLRNIEHHHFKFPAHRRPGDVHVHFFGTDYLSFGDGIQLASGDVMSMRFEGFGRALQNPVRTAAASPERIEAIPLG
ncbi:MAG TPA: AraD1 family protein [Candidatus Acidoferrales bacterium]|nr:AraD1 family protein [Candidatus Acidoferrales bacterium]